VRSASHIFLLSRRKVKLLSFPTQESEQWPGISETRRRKLFRDRRSPDLYPVVLGGQAEHDEPLVLALASGLKLHFPPATPAERVAELVHALEAQAES